MDEIAKKMGKLDMKKFQNSMVQYYMFTPLSEIYKILPPPKEEPYIKLGMDVLKLINNKQLDIYGMQEDGKLLYRTM